MYLKTKSALSYQNLPLVTDHPHYMTPFSQILEGLIPEDPLYRVTKKKKKNKKTKTELTKSLTTHEMLFSLKQKFYRIMYNLCSQHLQSINSVQQKLFVLQPYLRFVIDDQMYSFCGFRSRVR